MYIVIPKHIPHNKSDKEQGLPVRRCRGW